MIQPYVLILADVKDLHASAVRHYILKQEGVTPVIVDTAYYPKLLRLSFTLDGAVELRFPATDHSDAPSAALWPRGMKPPHSIWLSEVRSIWLRRRREHSLSDELKDEADRFISYNDSRAALDGLLHVAMLRNVKVLNSFSNEIGAGNKVLQLAVAQECGFHVPRTLISNDPERSSTFVAKMQSSGRRVIAKGFRPPNGAIVFTRFVSDVDLERLGLLDFSPVIFQEYVAGDDLRVTVVGERIFAAQVHLSSSEKQVDWRQDYFNRVSRCDVDLHTACQIRELMKRLGIEFGAIDLKRASDGTITFLEVNTGGQFLFVEIQTGLAISSAVAELLVCGRCSNPDGESLP